MARTVKVSEFQRQMRAEAEAEGCEACGGTGGRYVHAASCSSEFCVGNGDEHSCSGTWRPCDCNSDAEPDDGTALTDDEIEAMERHEPRPPDR